MGAGPAEMVSATELCGGTMFPAGGVVPTAIPLGTDAYAALGWTISPASSSTAVAASSEYPATAGTAIERGPALGTSVIVVPSAADETLGRMAATVPVCFAVCRALAMRTEKPRARRSEAAEATGLPSTCGSATRLGSAGPRIASRNAATSRTAAAASAASNMARRVGRAVGTGEPCVARGSASVAACVACAAMGGAIRVGRADLRASR